MFDSYHEAYRDTDVLVVGDDGQVRKGMVAILKVGGGGGHLQDARKIPLMTARRVTTALMGRLTVDRDR